MRGTSLKNLKSTTFSNSLGFNIKAAINGDWISIAVTSCTLVSRKLCFPRDSDNVYFLFVVRSLICLYSVEALYSYDYYVVRLLIMFPLLIRVYDSYTKYTTVKPCKPLLLQQPTRRRQPVPWSTEAHKVARPNFNNNPRVVQGHKCSASGVHQPCKATSQVLSQLKHLQGQEDSGAVPSLRTLRGSCRLGSKVYISSPTGQKDSLTLLTRNESHSANCEGKATA